MSQTKYHKERYSTKGHRGKWLKLRGITAKGFSALGLFSKISYKNGCDFESGPEMLKI